jgi:ATP-binding cassette subfamily G (WHITE) protein 2
MIRAHLKGNTTPPPASSSSFKLSATAMRLETLTPRFSIGSPQSESSPFMREDIALDTPQLENMLGSPGTPKEMHPLPTPPTPELGNSPPGSPTERSESEASESHLVSQGGRQSSRGHAIDAPSRSKWIEVRVLFWRTSQNILRHRSLLVLHVVLSLTLALCGGLIFNHVTNDLAGFQNRSGAFFFILTFFGFASMSSMDLFIAERAIFLRETGAMYYGAMPYFLAKASLDALLLRVLPATLFASIFYWIMGLQNKPSCFFMFMLTLVLFNVAAGAICVLVGVLSRRVGPANLAATVVFLIMLLFGGFLLNSQTMPAYVGWVKHFSIFSYAFEILMTNELKGLLLKFDAPGYPPVPVYGDVFLKTLGMDYANRYYDLTALALIAGGLNVLAFLFLALQVPIHNDMAVDDDPQFRGRRDSSEDVGDDTDSSSVASKSPAHKDADIV